MKVLLVLERAPYEAPHSQETIELALTLLAFDQRVDLLVVEKGIFQLNASQRPSLIGARGISQLLEMAKWYGLGQIWFEREALARMKGKELLFEGEEISKERIAELLQSYDLVLRA